MEGVIVTISLIMITGLLGCAIGLGFLIFGGYQELKNKKLW